MILLHSCHRVKAANDLLAGQGGFQGQGVRGLKMLGCRDLTYRLIFLACVSQVHIAAACLKHSKAQPSCHAFAMTA